MTANRCDTSSLIVHYSEKVLKLNVNLLFSRWQVAVLAEETAPATRGDVQWRRIYFSLLLSPRIAEYNDPSLLLLLLPKYTHTSHGYLPPQSCDNDQIRKWRRLCEGEAFTAS